MWFKKIIIITILGLSSNFVSAKPLCDPKKIKDPHDLQMSENKFNSRNAEKAIEYLNNAIPELLRESKTLREFQNNSTFFIGYPNHLTTLNGYLLKLEVEKSQLKLNNIKKDNSNYKALNKDYVNKLTKFCTFFYESAVYVD